MNKTLYFSINAKNDPSNDVADAVLINADLFLGMTPVTETSTKMMFEDIDGTAAESVVTLTHATCKNVEVMEDVCEALASEPKSGLIIVADTSNGAFCSPHITDAALAL